MGARKGTYPGLVAVLFKYLVNLYPARFRKEFSGELCAVITDRLDDAREKGLLEWWAAVLDELRALARSIPAEHWHSINGGKEAGMAAEDPVYLEIRQKNRRLRLRKVFRTTAVLAALAACWFIGIYAFASLRVFQVKSLGVYQSPEEAIRSFSTDRWGVKGQIGGIRCSPVSFEDKNERLRWCSASVWYEQNPEGNYHNPRLSAGYFVRLRDGWVHMPETDILVGVPKVLQLYSMEGFP
jgi:hypothetical protein